MCDDQFFVEVEEGQNFQGELIFEFEVEQSEFQEVFGDLFLVLFEVGFGDDFLDLESQFMYNSGVLSYSEFF